MSTVTRSIRSLIPRADFICSRCVQLSTSATLKSGHNRWSKIKHDKGAVDAKKNVQRSILSREIALCSKLYGGDPKTNPRLATILTTAKKAGFPKASMEAAIARGQGKSTTGAALENVTLEVIMPPTIAMIIECETDNKSRTMMDLRYLVKSHGGNVTPTSYLFQKKGRVVFETDDRKIEPEDVLLEAIEAGAEDLEEDDDGSIVVWTEPNKTTAVAEALQKSHDLKVESSDIIWDPNEDTMVGLESENAESEATALSTFLEALQDNPNVQGVYANLAQGKLSHEVWEELRSNFDS